MPPIPDDAAKRFGRVLVVDDSPTVLDWLVAVLSSEFEVMTAGSCRAALACLQQKSFQVMLTDFELGDGNGLDLIRNAMKAQADLAGILMTAHKDHPEVRAAQKAGRTLVLFKPVDAGQLVGWVRNAVTMARLSE